MGRLRAKAVATLGRRWQVVPRRAWLVLAGLTLVSFLLLLDDSGGGQNAYSQGMELGWALYDALPQDKQATVNTADAQARLCTPAVKTALIRTGSIQTAKDQEPLRFDRFDMSQVQPFDDGCIAAGIGER